MFLRHFKKSARTLANMKSIGTIKAKTLLRKLDEQNGAKSIKNKQKNVECDGEYQHWKDEGGEGEE